MAVTHADLRPGRRSTELGSKTGAFLMVLCILFGLFCFILSLIAEASRSKVTWVSTRENGEEERYECTYSGSGKTPLLCAASAFMALAIAMVVQHTYLLIAVSKSTSSALVTWDLDSDFAKTLTWQAGFFFVTTWMCFAVGEILLLIGISVESGHLKHWSTPRSGCLIIGQGLFSAAGVFGLATVCLAAGLYITALRAQRLIQGQENVRREVWEASALHASPPTSPGHHLATAANETPMIRQNQNDQHLLAHYLSAFDKHSNLV
ncbi:unnamed protein product [Ilex paraguariensis]|uniref:Transmembrane protein n=1 Tax=Ilex paraguariensis TaxID=185542 RepID=A0ABC8RRJ8_9AQUA